MGAQDARAMQDGVDNIPTSCLKKLGVLGEGAFGVVEKALLTPQDADGSPRAKAKRIVAVKKLKEGTLDNDGELQGFLHECRLMKKLNHP